MSIQYNYGLSKAHYAVIEQDPITGVQTFAKPKKIMASTALTITPVGDEQKYYADNIVAIQVVSNQGYDGTLTGASLSKDFRADVLQEEADSQGVVVEYANKQPKPFALLYEVDGSTEGTRYVYWNCMAKRPDSGATTKQESIDVDEQALSFSAMPREKDNSVKGYVDKGHALYETWFETVYEADSEGAIDSGGE